MFDVIVGLPVHTLVIHTVVIVLPVAALATVALAIQPRWRSRWIGWAVGLNGIALLLTFFARRSGEELYARLEALGGAEVAADHRRLGLTLIWYVLAFFGLSIVTWVLDRTRSGVLPPTLAAVATAIAAVVAVYTLVLVGHSGTDAVYGDLIENT